ncbi:MAG TPA: hypothetical protein VG269_21850 [Tepidisphaeraceae bacterium]|nr:hypothetical protein [Tepidisphaeraceae bacterium]
MKSLVLMVLLLAGMAAIGIIGCKISGVDPRFKDLSLACGIALAATTLALIPALLQRNVAQTAGMFQASLIGTVFHLGLILAAGLILVMTKRATTPFVLWLLGAYWATLIGLCVVFAKLIRTAPTPAKK